MTEFSISYSATMPTEGMVVAPSGFTTPQSACLGMTSPGNIRTIAEETTGQHASLIEPASADVRLTYTFSDQGAAYSDVIFAPRETRFTRFAGALVAEVGEIAPEASALERIRAIACATAERFTYGHPENRFTDGLDEVPALGCGMVEGSCVDINTYFIASLRAAGLEAGYITGFFFPAEKGDHCTDGHCWVATRAEGVTQEWDIAHHLKLGTRDIYPGLNPKPGFRAACFHSMGLTFPEIGVTEVKALIEPFCLAKDGSVHRFEDPEIRLHHEHLSAAAE